MATDKHLAALTARLDRLEGLLTARIPQVFDPSPDDLGRFGGWQWGGGRIPVPWPNPGDPVPMDISRLNRAQLQLSLETLKAQRIRLDAMETMLSQQLDKTKG